MGPARAMTRRNYFLTSRVRSITNNPTTQSRMMTYLWKERLLRPLGLPKTVRSEHLTRLAAPEEAAAVRKPTDQASTLGRTSLDRPGSSAGMSPLKKRVRTQTSAAPPRTKIPVRTRVVPLFLNDRDGTEKSSSRRPERQPRRPDPHLISQTRSPNTPCHHHLHARVPPHNVRRLSLIHI